MGAKPRRPRNIKLMSRGPQTFRQRDLTATLKAMVNAGVDVRAVEIDPITGKIVILTIAGSDREPTTDLDKWLARHDVR